MGTYSHANKPESCINQHLCNCPVWMSESVPAAQHAVTTQHTFEQFATTQYAVTTQHTFEQFAATQYAVSAEHAFEQFTATQHAISTEQFAI